MIHYTKKKNLITFLTALLFSLNIVCMESFLPTSIYGYTIKASKTHNPIITDLKRVPELFFETLAHIMQPDDIDEHIVATIGSIHNDLGTNQSIFLMELIHNLALKTEQDSATILTFINQQRKMHTFKDMHGNVDKTANFFAAFKDAKKLFYFLVPIQNKILNNESLTENEYHYLLKNMHLMDWKLENNHVTVKRSFAKRFNQAIARNGYFNNLKWIATSTIMELIDVQYLNGQGGRGSAGGLAIFLCLGSILIFSIHATHVPPRQETIPFKQDNETVSLEDMDIIIEHTPWLD